MVATTWAPLPPGKVHWAGPQAESAVPLAMVSVGSNPEQEPVDRPAGFDTYHWLQTETGLGEVRFGTQRVTLGPRQGLLLPQGLPHDYRGLREPWSTYYLTFGGTLADLVVAALGRPTSVVLTWAAGSNLDTTLADLADRARHDDLGSPARRSSEVYRFLLQLRDEARPMAPGATAADLNDRLRPLFEHVETHLGDPGLGVDQMAAYLGVSPRQLSDLFGKLGPTSPYQYLRERRLIRARQLLLWNPGLEVQEVARQVGYRDPSHFIASFRQAVGQSPDRFRHSSSAGI